MDWKQTDSIIFDLDGTLWDASGTCAEAWNESFQQLGSHHVIDQSFVRSVSGLRIEKVFDQYFNFIPSAKHQELLNIYKQQEQIFMKKSGGLLFPGVKNVLTKLSSTHKLFVVSNCLTGYIENFLQFTGLQNIFADFESSGNTGLPKSENIQLIIARNQLRHPVYVGDTTWDQEAATAAKIPFIYASYGFGKAIAPDHAIERFDELLTLFDN